MPSKAKTYKWLGLFSLMPSIAMIFTDQAVLPVALPTIQKHLGATYSELWWSINAYLLLSAVLLLAGGKLGDRIGHRNAFILGMLLFAVASALGGVSPDIYWLIGSRALQGNGAAIMIPASSLLIMSLFPQHERGKAIGINVSVSSLFLICGPLIGGYLTESFSWRWIFWINLPLAAIGLILQLLFLSPSSKIKQSFDPWGFFYFVISSTSLVILTMQGSSWGWISLKSVSILALSLISGFFLFRREKKVKNPFIDLSFFRNPIYKAVNISVFATQFVLMITFYRAIFFQDVLDWSPMKSGIISFIASFPVLFLSPLGGWLADRWGHKTPIAAGFLFLIFSFLWTPFVIQGSLWMLLLGLTALGCGVPLLVTPSYSSAVGVIPPKKAGSAFGILATTRSLSGSFGVAIIIALTTMEAKSSWTHPNPILGA